MVAIGREQGSCACLYGMCVSLHSLFRTGSGDVRRRELVASTTTRIELTFPLVSSNSPPRLPNLHQSSPSSSNSQRSHQHLVFAYFGSGWWVPVVVSISLDFTQVHPPFLLLKLTFLPPSSLFSLFPTPFQPSLPFPIDLKTLLPLLPSSPPSSLYTQSKTLLASLPARIKDKQDKEKDEMMDKLKGLGNSVLGRFGLSTEK